MRRIMMMMMPAVALASVGLAACGGDGSSEAKAPSATDITVHTVAEQVGTGCSQSPIKGGGTLVVKGADGTVLATGATAKTPNTDSCDWTTVVAQVAASDFYTIETGDGTTIGTVPAATATDGTLDIEVSFDGSASIS